MTQGGHYEQGAYLHTSGMYLQNPLYLLRVRILCLQNLTTLCHKVWHYLMLSFTFSIPFTLHSIVLELHAITVTGRHTILMHSWPLISSWTVITVKHQYPFPQLLLLFHCCHGLGRTWVSGASWLGWWVEAGRSQRPRSPDLGIYYKQTILIPVISRALTHTLRWSTLTPQKALLMRTILYDKMVGKSHQSIFSYLHNSTTQMEMANDLQSNGFFTGHLPLSSVLFLLRRMPNGFISLRLNESGGLQWLGLSNDYMMSSRHQMPGMRRMMSCRSRDVMMGVN